MKEESLYKKHDEELNIAKKMVKMILLLIRPIRNKKITQLFKCLVYFTQPWQTPNVKHQNMIGDCNKNLSNFVNWTNTRHPKSNLFSVTKHCMTLRDRILYGQICQRLKFISLKLLYKGYQTFALYTCIPHF